MCFQLKFVVPICYDRFAMINSIHILYVLYYRKLLNVKLGTHIETALLPGYIDIPYETLSEYIIHGKSRDINIEFIITSRREFYRKSLDTVI